MSDSNKSIRWGYLPDEILTRIFTFLPIKSVIICTCVSKTWKSQSKNQNPNFISTNLHHSHNKNKNNLLLLSLSRNDKEVYTLHKEDDDPDFTEYTSFESPFHAPAPHFHDVIGTCNGLLCLSYSLPNHANEIFLWNPCVRKFLQLPSPNVTFDTHGKSCKSFGFGFDPKTNDYKVVRILSQPEVDVYSLSTGEWRMLSASASLPPTCAIISRGPPAFANGALHWIAFTNDKKRFVTAIQCSAPHQCPSLGMPRPCPVPVGFRRNAEVILLNIGLGLVSWNPDSQNIKNLEINGYFDTFFGSYVESLVLFDKATKGVDCVVTN